MKRRKGFSQILIPLLLVGIVFVVYLTGGDLPVTFEETVEYIDKKVYPINNNLKLEKIEAAGIKVTSSSIHAFIQECKRIEANVGAVSIGVDFELRVLFAFDPTKPSSQREFYFLQFK